MKLAGRTHMLDRFRCITHALATLLRPLSVAVLLLGGCGVVNIERTIFPTQITDADGNPIFVQDIQAITQNPDLTTDDMTTALRGLGIESDELIQAIIADGLPG